MKKRIVILSALVISSTFLLSCLFNNQDKESVILALTYNILKSYHYETLSFDDAFAKKVFDKYLENLDYSKRFLLQSDVKKLKKNAKNLSKDMKEANVQFFEKSYEMLAQRQQDAKNIYEEVINEPFDLNKKEYLQTDPKKIEFAKNKKELKDYWRKQLKYEIIREIDNEETIIENKKAKGDTSVKEKTQDELLKDAIKKVKKNYDDYFERLSKLRKEDYFSVFVNAITLSCDPHSEYFPPKIKEDFNISMSGELEGIGATLTQRYGQIKVVNIVVGGAAWKEGELEKGDIILKVAQEGQEPVSVANMRLDDAVRLIRGKKGTKVTLTVQKVDGTIKDITIVRDKIVIEETYVKSVILKNPKTGKKVAYVYLPSFYVDFQNKDGRQCAEDMKKELLKLKDEKVDGIIIDLRNNGGGSLAEVVKMGGFFIKKGPIVQVRNRYGIVQQLKDKDASILYDGNMLIMTNQFSASASEIFAAAMKDYDRAVIYGTKQTLGKGTVQQMVDLDKVARIGSSMKPLGALKFTIQKFYRINGGSTQMKGVKADIVFPSVYSYINTGESSFDNAMPWDKISPANYEKWHPAYNLDSLRKWSINRTKNDSAFIETDLFAKYLKNENDSSIVPLNLTEFRKEQKEKRAIRKKFNKKTNKKINLNFDFLKDDQKEMKQDTLMKFRYENWTKTLRKDFKLQEAYNIVEDMNKFKK